MPRMQSRDHDRCPSPDFARGPVDDIGGPEPSKRSRRGQHITHGETLASFAFHQPPLPPAARS